MSNIIAKNWPQFLRGTGITLLISIIGTVVGTFIGLMIGVYRTAPKATNKFVALLQNSSVGCLMSISKFSVVRQ